MTGLGDTRASIEDRLPDWVAGRLDDDESARIAAAVEGDPELTREAELLRALRATAPVPPPDLGDRIVTVAREDDGRVREGDGPHGDARRSHRWGPRGGLSLLAAAALVLVIGTVLVERGRPSSAATNDVFDDLVGPSLGESSMVAGAPVLDDLSDEELTALLEELEG